LASEEVVLGFAGIQHPPTIARDKVQTKVVRLAALLRDITPDEL